MKPCIATHGSATRNRAGGRAWTLGEICPVPLTCPLKGLQINDVTDWVDVETSPRYQPTGNATYCNIFVTDMMHLLGLYIPRQWWVDPSTGAYPIVYGKNTREMNANALVPWMRIYGPTFGWQVYDNLPELKDGDVCVVIGQKAVGHGHTQLLYSLEGELVAAQAGVTNFNEGQPYTESWWKKNYIDVVWGVISTNERTIGFA